jgi:hypothetical protein
MDLVSFPKFSQIRLHAPHLVEPKDFDFSKGAGGVLQATSTDPWLASFMVETRTVSDGLRAPNFRSCLMKTSLANAFTVLPLS